MITSVHMIIIIKLSILLCKHRHYHWFYSPLPFIKIRLCSLVEKNTHVTFLIR